MDFNPLRAFCNRCLAAGSLAAALPGLLSAAELGVTPSALGLPPAGAQTSTQTIFLHATRAGALKVNSVIVEYVSGPDDTRLDAAAAKVVDFTPGVSGPTIAINIALTRSPFVRAGTYKIALRVKGERMPEASQQSQPVQQPTPVEELVELSLTRAAAQITVNIPNSSRVVIDRGFPWKKGGTAVAFSVAQNSGPAIERLNFTASAVTRSSDSELLPGKINLVPPDIAVTNGTAPGTLTFSEFSRAGDFQTNLTFTSPALAQPVVVPLLIRVKDGWPLPLLVILAGVFAGAAVYFLVRTWRPRQLSAYRLAQLQSRLDALSNAIEETTTRSDYDRLLTRLYNLTEGIDIDATTDQAIGQLEIDIAALQAKLAKVEADANDALKQLRDALTRARSDLTPYARQAAGKLGEIEKEVARCTELYAMGRSEAALACIKAAKDKLDDTRAGLAEAALDTMRNEIDSVPEDKKAELLGKANQAAENLKKPSADIGQILATFRRAIDGAKGTTTADYIPMAAVAAPPAQMAIAVSTPPEARRAGTQLQFTITPAARKQVDSVTWSFEAIRVSGTSLSVTRIFPIPGRYLVTAEIRYRDGDSDSAAPLRLVILPSEAQTLTQRIASNIRGVDYGLLAVSIVVAGISGLLDRYSYKAFGTLADYCWAFLWGFGIDNVVRGFGATFTRLSARN
jgi:tetratricopeptide (TPR) repeat protein